jgi:hypothetical protein
MNTLLDPARRGRLLLILAFVIALGFTGYYVVRTVSAAIYWSQHKNEPIKGWMPIGYVAHSYHVPPHILSQAIGLPQGPPDHRPIAVIARSQGRTVATLVAKLDYAIVHARPPYPPPAPPKQTGR